MCVRYEISTDRRNKEESLFEKNKLRDEQQERREKRPLLLRDLGIEMVGTSKRASNQANLFNDDAFNNNKSCGGKYALRAYYTRIFRVCNARQVPPRVQHVCTMRITTPLHSYVQVVRLEWHARIKVSKLQRRTIATRRTMLFSS